MSDFPLGSKKCRHCGAIPNKIGETNSGRPVMQCPDCYLQFYLDGNPIPGDVRVIRTPKAKEG